MEDEVFFQPSQRNSHHREGEQNQGHHPQSHALEKEEFPNQEFRKFKLKKAGQLVCQWLGQSFSEKKVSAFYLIWDNVQYCILEDVGNPFLRRCWEVFETLKTLPPRRRHAPRRFQKRKPRGLNRIEQFPTEPQQEHLSQTGVSHNQTETNVYVESEFTSMGGSERQIPGDLSFKDQGRVHQYSQHYKNKSNNFAKPSPPGKLRASLSGDFQNENHMDYNGARQSRQYFTEGGKGNGTGQRHIRERGDQDQSRERKEESHNRMRKLRETLEKEQVERIKQTHFSSTQTRGKTHTRRLRKNEQNNFSFSNNVIEPEHNLFGQTPHQLNFFKKKNKQAPSSHENVFTSDSQPAAQQKKTAVGRIFFLLSKRFQDTRYKNFFMDQVEVLVYKHGIRDPQIMSLLENLDLRFGLDELCPEESEAEDATKGVELEAEKQLKMQRRLEKKYTKDNIAKLEHVMMLFRADQLFAPLVRHFGIKKMSFNRHFFVNLRMFAKLAPFRKLHKTVQERVWMNQRGAFSQILFYNKPNLRLLLLISAISKVKQRHIVDSFRRIYAFYYERLKKQKLEEQDQSNIPFKPPNPQKKNSAFSRAS